MTRTLHTAAAVLALALLAAACSSKVDNAQHVNGIRQALEGTPPWVERGEVGKRLWQIEREFYEARGYPAGLGRRRRDDASTGRTWSSSSNTPRRHGLDPARYGPREFEQLRDASQTRTAARASRWSAFPRWTRG